MNTVLQVNEQTIAAEEIVPLLNRYQLLPHFLREVIVDQAIASISCSDQERTQIRQQTAKQNPPNLSGSALQLEASAVRSLKIQKFKQAKWGRELKTYFLERKDQLDQVIYSLIRTQDAGVANELFFRLEAREQSFTELAERYSQGPEAQTGGLIGPVEIGNYHPSFAQILALSPIGEVVSPIQLEDWLIIVRIEKRISAQLDQPTCQRLLNELFDRWLQARLDDALQSINSTSLIDQTGLDLLAFSGSGTQNP